MLNFSAIYTIWERELIRYWRDKARIVTTVIQPLMFLAIFGTGLRSALASSSLGIDFLKFMYPGIIAMNVMGVAFFSTISTVWDREFGFLKEILVAPISRTSIALGKTLGATTVASTQALLLLILAPVIGISLHPALIPKLIVFMLILAFAISGLGLLIASLLKSLESFGLVMNLLVFPMFFLSGAFFPLTAVPVWMKALSVINPLTYGVDALRGIMLSNQISAGELARIVLHSQAVNAFYLLVFSAVMISAAVLAFNKRN
ncbi:MAG: ABC transporter permease [Candidatus Moranbacteria bacterium]|nr:ABC transporter permease [Candidatus Moranbacteria bacterium]